jgi:hypothetical protein
MRMRNVKQNLSLINRMKTIAVNEVLFGPSVAQPETALTHTL